MTEGLRLAALDLSLTATGVARRFDGGPVAVSTIQPATGGSQRLRAILFDLARACTDAHCVVLEGPSYGSTGAGVWQLAELHGLVKYWLWRHDLPVVLVPPAKLKLYALGKGSGKGTDKDAVLLAVDRRFGDVAKVANNNEADALALLAMAADQYGEPLAPVPARHREALAGLPWPDLTALKETADA